MDKLFLVWIIFAICSCKEITYKEPQPRGKNTLKEIPQTLRGEYLLTEENGSTDTLVVTREGYHVIGDSTKGVLGDSLVLKKYKGYYFFNDNESPEWLLRIIKQEENGDLSYMLMNTGEKSFNEFVYKLNKEIEIDSFEIKGEMLYQIDPSPKKLIDLIKKGYFKKTIVLRKLK